MTLMAAWTGLAVLGLLIAERRGSRLGVWLTKPLASLGFVTLAVVGGFSTPFGRWMLLGLCLCALGDVLLIPRANAKPFLLGMGSFALGHAAYARAFCLLGIAPWAAATGFAIAASGGIATLRWLGPRLGADMHIPVRIYVAVIAVMVACALGASVNVGDATLAVGALAFAVSDLSVARERFTGASFTNLLWGLPLYYAAQLLLASSTN